MDFAEFRGNKYFVLIDSYSKWIEVVPMNSTTSKCTIDVLRNMFASFGLPRELVSDNGPQFTAKEFKDFMSGNGIKHTLTPHYHPASNGAAERSVQILKRALKKHFIDSSSGRNVSEEHMLASFLLSYRMTHQASTGRSPS